MLTLASPILLAGSLSDRWGRRPVFLAGLSWFTLASVLYAAAPGIGWLIAARAVQGIGGALMTPASLAPSTPDRPCPSRGLRHSATA
jgi:MFS family permease